MRYLIKMVTTLKRKCRSAVSVVKLGVREILWAYCVVLAVKLGVRELLWPYWVALAVQLGSISRMCEETGKDGPYSPPHVVIVECTRRNSHCSWKICKSFIQEPIRQEGCLEALLILRVCGGCKSSSHILSARVLLKLLNSCVDFLNI